ncbi:MAG: NAD(P)-dependent oxidoreductase [Candidatus Eiseniibacteriota bacterium]
MAGASDGRTAGFIGIGNMGWPMAANLVRAGHDVVVYDTDGARLDRFVTEIGGRKAGSLAELGKAVDMVVTMLPTGPIVRSVMLEQEGGLAAHLPKGALLADMSSSDPIGTRALGAALAERGIAMVDAPVSGAVPRAKDATLTIMLGADDKAAIARAKPVLSAMGNRFFETGRLGSAHAMKGLNNYVAAAGLAAASEALIAGKRFGLDPAHMIEIMNTSSGRNFATETVLKSDVVTGTFAAGFAVALMAKDIKIAADLAAGLELDLPMMRFTDARWREAVKALGGDKDNTEVYRLWDKEAGGA